MHYPAYKSNQGFSLVEIMVVVAIAGILVAIAIPTYAGFRQSAFENVVRNDVRNAASVCEAYYAQEQKYPPFGPFTGTVSQQVFQIEPGTTIKISQGVTLEGILQGDRSLVISGTHLGANKRISYSSTIGG